MSEKCSQINANIKGLDERTESSNLATLNDVIESQASAALDALVCVGDIVGHAGSVEFRGRNKHEHRCDDALNVSKKDEWFERNHSSHIDFGRLGAVCRIGLDLNDGKRGALCLTWFLGAR